MADRWTLTRAGITNVYQYGEETLHFGGGRLLLRGVNGSGKSTAMNMLLPFLLEARTARIDAAGEQSGVLRSWMLSGRDEQQPQGYLWIEFGRGEDHLTCGCGIKANRDTDRVTTWWFITERRPGIDLALVEGRQPLGPDALGEALEPGALYRENQRPAYRAAVRDRLFGGADLDQHLRLLHVVRSPRVGDRIDVDLPGYLEDALPQLSEEALDDAAQPLEDLEEHRRNVEDLTRTANTLAAIETVYRSYGRTELHQRTGAALELIAARKRLARSETDAERLHRQATDEQLAATAATAGHEQDERRLDGEIRDLEASDAYKAGAQLDDLRNHVSSLEGQVTRATEDVERRDARRSGALDAVAEARQDAENAEQEMVGALSTLADLSAEAGLSSRPPDAPAVELGPVEDQEGEGHGDDGRREEGHGVEGPDVPRHVLDTDAVTARTGDVRAATHLRQGDVAEVGKALDALDAAEGELRRAAERDADATDQAEEARTRFVDARHRLQLAADGWRDAVASWADRLADHQTGHSVEGAAPDLAEEVDIVGHHQEIAERCLAAAQHVVDHHGRRRATLLAERTTQVDEVAELQEAVDGLNAQELPEPPASPWQRDDRSTCLADLVDFVDGVSDGDRAGLEAAMVASGLLGAEIDPSGDLRLDQGDLVVRPGRPVSRPLTDLLDVTVPDHLAGTVDADRVAAVLGAISVDPIDLGAAAASEAVDHGGESDGAADDARDGDDARAEDRADLGDGDDNGDQGGGRSGDGEPDRTVVTVDGRFRTGLLRGHHAVEVAEHIGVTARRAALERQRAEAAEALARAQARRDELDALMAETEAATTEAVELRRAFPPVDELVRAGAAADQSDQAATEAGARAEQRHVEHREAELRHGETADHLRRSAATLTLPHDRPSLHRVAATLDRIAAACTAADQAVVALGRAVGRWMARGRDWSGAVADQRSAQQSLDDLRGELEVQASKLATLEDSIGLEHRQVLASIETSRADLARTRTDLSTARGRSEEAAAEVATTRERHRQAVEQRRGADERCVAALPALRATLAVPGLLAGALDEGTATPDSSRPRHATTEGSSTGPTHDGPGSASDPGPDAEPAAADPATLLPTVAESPEGLQQLATAIQTLVPAPAGQPITAEGIRLSLRQRRDALGAGWDAEDHQPDPSLPLHVVVNGPEGTMALPDAARHVRAQLGTMASLLSAKQDQALRNLLQGLVAKEVAEKLHAAGELVGRMNARLDTIETTHGIGVSLRWKRRDDLDGPLAETIALLAKAPDLRTTDDDQALTAALSRRIADARAENPEQPYRDLIAAVLDYRDWHQMRIIVRRPGHKAERLTRRTALSEGEKKMTSYLPLFAAVAASCDALAEREPAAPRFVLLDDAFAKVSEDNHAKLFGLLVELDLDFIATSERLWGTHDTVPSLAITEVIRDADLGAIVLEHSHWDGRTREDG